MLTRLQPLLCVLFLLLCSMVLQGCVRLPSSYDARIVTLQVDRLRVTGFRYAPDEILTVSHLWYEDPKVGSGLLIDGIPSQIQRVLDDGWQNARPNDRDVFLMVDDERFPHDVTRVVVDKPIDVDSILIGASINENKRTHTYVLQTKRKSDGRVKSFIINRFIYSESGDSAVFQPSFDVTKYTLSGSPVFLFSFGEPPRLGWLCSGYGSVLVDGERLEGQVFAAPVYPLYEED